MYGSASEAMSGETRAGPFGPLASASGTVPCWYAGWSKSALTPPPAPPRNSAPGSGEVYFSLSPELLTISSRVEPQPDSNWYPPLAATPSSCRRPR